MDESTPADARYLAASLAPQLVAACDNRLSTISWFRTDWQRGGAATGTATLDTGEGGPVPVVVKLPVVARELFWTRRLGADGASVGPTGSTSTRNGSVDAQYTTAEPVAPRLYASGHELGGYDLTWLVIERIAHGPIATHWSESTIPRIADAAARFYAATRSHPIDRGPHTEEWADELHTSLKQVAQNKLPDHQRWTKAIKSLLGRIDDIVTEWRARPIDDWIHGDLHPANAMSRGDGDDGPVTLIDLAEVRPGHWVEDAVYLERLLWTRPDLLKPAKPVRAIADARKRYGLPVDPAYPRLAMIRRALLAATAPCFLQSEGSPRHLEACLNWLDIANRELK